MHDIFSIEDLKTWVDQYNRSGYLKGNELHIANFSGSSLSLHDFKNLSITIDFGSRNSNLNLVGGKYRNIQIPEGNLDIKLEKVENVISLKSESICTLKQSCIEYCESEALLYIEGCDISILKHKYGNLEISNSNIEHIESYTSSFINGLNINGILFFSIEDYSPRNDCSITLNFKKNSELHLKRCNLEKVKFDRCDFSDTILYSFNSKIKLADYYNTKWFRKVRRLDSEGHTTKIIPRDECRQLKETAQKFENSIDADYFKSMELHARFQELKWHWDQIDSKITLGLNLISNFYERSWLLPMAWILVFGLVMFIPYYFSSKLWIDEHQNISEYIKYYWVFLNPIHDFDILGKGNATGLSLFIDTFHRIFNSYFIYQLVAAFRKFRVVG